MYTDSYGNTRFPGVYRGIVAAVGDPLGKGRVKLQVPQILGDSVTDWAWGSYSAGVETADPNVGMGVWVQFEGGDPSYPLWSNKFDSSGSVDYIQLNTERAEGSTEIGMLTWSVEDETPEVVVGNGEVTLQIGQESHTRVANNTGETIPNGTVVFLSGGADEHGHPYVSPYIANGSVSPFRVEGITTQAIPNGAEGLVTVQGKVRGLNTSAYLEGEILFASTIALGGFQTEVATPPNDIVKLATVVLSDAVAGEILVNVVPLINQLQTNLVFFPTTTAADVSGYFRLVNSIIDPNYNTTAVAVPVPSTGSLNSGTGILVGSLIADANEFVGDPGDVEMEVTGSIAKTFGNANTSSTFYFRVFKRTSGGTETLLGESSKVGPPSEAAPIANVQFSAQANVVFETFSNTDRLVIKFYADVIESGNQQYSFTYGGISPVRALLPVPVNTVSTPPAEVVSVDTAAFDGSLSSADNTVQKALDKLDNAIPRGTVQMYAGQGAANSTGSTAGYGTNGIGTNATGTAYSWLLCNGDAVSRTVYASLFAVIGTTYGAGDGTTFNLPNLQGRVPIGLDTTQTEFDVRGETGGSKTLTIGTANLPAHTHSIDHNHAEVTSSSDSHNHDFTTDNDTHNHDVSDTGFTGAAVFVASGGISVADNLSGTRTTDNDTHNHSGTTDTDTHSHTVNLPNFEGTSGSTGSGTALPSLPPYIVLNYIIKS